MTAANLTLFPQTAFLSRIHNWCLLSLLFSTMCNNLSLPSVSHPTKPHPTKPQSPSHAVIAVVSQEFVTSTAISKYFRRAKQSNIPREPTSVPMDSTTKSADLPTIPSCSPGPQARTFWGPASWPMWTSKGLQEKEAQLETYRLRAFLPRHFNEALHWTSQINRCYLVVAQRPAVPLAKRSSNLSHTYTLHNRS